MTRDRYAQCDGTCTADCGACKGAVRPADMRRDLVDLLVAHQRRDNGGGCLCGAVALGESYPEHIADLVLAQTPPEVAAAGEQHEVAARAMAEAEGHRWDRLAGPLADRYRRLAAAAIAVLPPSPAEEAVRALLRDIADGRYPGTGAELAAFVVRRLGAALASPAPAPQGEEREARQIEALSRGYLMDDISAAEFDR